MADFDTDKALNGKVQAAYLQLGSGGKLIHLLMTQYSVKNKIALLGSPNENGITQIDNKVIQPTTITIRALMKSPDFTELDKMIDALNEYQLSKAKATFMCKSEDMYYNMLLMEVEEIGTNDKLDAVEVAITMQEFLEHGIK